MIAPADPAAPTLIPAGNPGPLTGRGNNTWLINGADPALIDAGTGAPGHVQALERALAGRDLRYLFVTHGHPDHVSGRPALAQRWPRLRASKLPEPGETGWELLADGQVVIAGDRPLIVVATPGHADDHVCFWNPTARAIYGGDMVVLGGSVLIPAGRGGNLRRYLQSLERLIGLAPEVIYPGHGNVIDRPVDVMTQYIQHRLERERQILACLRETGPDAGAIVSRIYVGLAESRRVAARLTVEAHLEKLRDEGRLEQDGTGT